MEVAKQAVKYYTQVTGNVWSDFYDKLPIALGTDIEQQSGEMWLIHMLVKTIQASGITLEELKMNKDVVKSAVDGDSRRQNGEFFTPEVWCAEGRKYFDKYIPNWHEYNVWDASCYTADTKVRILRGTDVLIVSASELKPDDKVYTLNPSTLKESWSGYHNLFFKTVNRIIKFNLYKCPSKPLKVTPDHRMVVRLYGSGQLLVMTAQELIDNMGKLNYSIPMPNDSETLITGYTEEFGEFDVWDLTTDNEAHCFAVSPTSWVLLFSGNCGSGNLMRTANHPVDKLFLSTLQETDVKTVSNMSEYKGATIFQCDFLDGIDYDTVNTDFLDKLPSRLQEIIRNDEPLIIYMNPPYKAGMQSKTEVGNYMQSISTVDCNLARAAYDIFYQFCWRVMRFVQLFDLKNTYYSFFGPCTFFTGTGASVLLKEFEHYFEYIDGMAIPANEFTDVGNAREWCIQCSLWKSTGSYYDESLKPKQVLLEQKVLLPDGSVSTKGRVLYTKPEQKMVDWVVAKDVTSLQLAPVMTSHLCFKGSDNQVKIAPNSAKLATNALGVMMNYARMTWGEQQSAIFSMPASISYTDITEENFWRCVVSFVFRNTYNATWLTTKQDIAAPNESVEGYWTWVYNALPLFLFDYKAMMSSLRDVEWNNMKIDIRNKLFYLSADAVRANCTDEVILKDMETHPQVNDFVLQAIEQAKPYWGKEAKELFTWCEAYTLASYNYRKSMGYNGSLECWDAGFQQIRTGCWDDKLNSELTRMLTALKDYLSKDLGRFGFMNGQD